MEKQIDFILKFLLYYFIVIFILLNLAGIAGLIYLAIYFLNR